MATQTPNLGLTLPVGTENVSRQVINGNNTLIDTFAGGVNTAMNQMGSNLGILETGDTATHAIAKGEYVTWKGASYTADAAISIGETLAATGGSKNLTACDKGIANALNSKKTNYPVYTSIETVVSSYTPTTTKTDIYTVQKDGNLMFIFNKSGGGSADCLYVYFDDAHIFNFYGPAYFSMGPFPVKTGTVISVKKDNSYAGYIIINFIENE